MAICGYNGCGSDYTVFAVNLVVVVFSVAVIQWLGDNNSGSACSFHMAASDVVAKSSPFDVFSLHIGS